MATAYLSTNDRRCDNSLIFERSFKENEKKEISTENGGPAFIEQAERWKDINIPYDDATLKGFGLKDNDFIKAFGRHIGRGVIAEGSSYAAIEGRHYYTNMQLLKESFNSLIQFWSKEALEGNARDISTGKEIVAQVVQDIISARDVGNGHGEGFFVDGLKEDRQAFGMLLGNDIDLHKSFQFPIATYPLSIVTPGSYLRQGQKRVLRNYMIEESNPVTSHPPLNAHWIYDGRAIT
eukprot:gene19366-21286_t